MTQVIIQGNVELATDIMAAASINYFAAKSVLVNQDAADTDILFILSGTTSVIANGRLVAKRGPGTHVGEMAMIDPSALRCASVLADTDVVVARVPESEFALIADRFPGAWRRLAVELSHRLRERNHRIHPPNPKPVVFIGSSSEALPVAQMLKSSLAPHKVEARLWTDLAVFKPGHFPAEDLLEQVRMADFAALVLAADDRVFSRLKLFAAPRDNVLCEVSMFMGALGRERALMLQPTGKRLKIPSDFLGITAIRYKPPIRQKPPDLTSACLELEEVIDRLGCI